MPIQIIHPQKKRSIPSSNIKKLIEIIAKAESKKKLGSVTFVFLDNAAMRKMNKKFLNHDYPTDVISFDLSTSRDIEGEVYIGLGQAASQAKEYGVPLSNEILRLAAHGFLHILGYDDFSPKKRFAMLKRGDDYIAQLK
jgi:rRNA maturation RNase YbeY